ncbi:MAG: hypothetical protein C0602_03135 [Denitrovibrio sp.]|nr:MAG: hypothetical protein C0602_03135 [Denitrovibrio sp.]
MIINREERTVIVKGSVVTLEDYELFKDMVSDSLKENKNELNIIFEDATLVNSAMIGFLIKTVKVDKVNLSIAVDNYKLYELLQMLSLVETLKVTKVK